MKPICVPCQRFFRPKKNGFSFIEQMPRVSGAAPGKLEPHLWAPYKLWVGDLWYCKGCGAEVVIGALQPVSEHFMPNFADAVKRLNPQLKVNDC